MINTFYSTARKGFQLLRQKIKHPIALKLHIPIVFLGLFLFVFLYFAYVYQTKSINHFQLKQLAETITDNLIISAQTNFKLSNLKRITNSLAAKNNVNRIILIEGENQKIIADNHNPNIGKAIQLGLSDREKEIYQTLNSEYQLLSYKFSENNFYYLHKTQLINSDFNRLHAYYIFIILDESETFINAPDILTLITTIFALGMVTIFLVLYLIQPKQLFMD